MIAFTVGGFLVLLLFGPPGCGKGTQSKLITNWLRIPAISTGDILRAEMRAGTDLGLSAQAIIATGGLVDDSVVNEMLVQRICKPDCAQGLLLDGYPRTVEQAQFLDQVLQQRRLPGATILHLEVPFTAIIGRMAARRQCVKCSAIYSMMTLPPKVDGICDDDGEPLIQRADDQEHVVAQRLKTYDELTRPVLAHYADHDYHYIRGDRSPSYIFEEITGILERRLPQNGNGRHG